MTEFERWIEQVESGEVLGRGLLAANLEHREALRLAFEAGREQQQEGELDDELLR